MWRPRSFVKKEQGKQNFQANTACGMVCAEKVRVCQLGYVGLYSVKNRDLTKKKKEAGFVGNKEAKTWFMKAVHSALYSAERWLGYLGL